MEKPKWFEYVKTSTTAGLVFTCLSVGIFGGSIMTNIESKKNLESAYLKDVNKDGLKDIVYEKTGQIYLQQKDGSFIDYKKAMEQVKQESINKLEKSLK